MSKHPFSIRHRAKRHIVGQVRAVFNDQARGERPVLRSDDALFPAQAMIWRVHGDVVSMMVGGMAALLLQMLHPAVLAGVWDHSNFRADMLGRLRRTARFIAITTYGERGAALAAIERVRAIHGRIAGVLPDGTLYRADDPTLLAWVHLSEAWCFLAAWQQYGDHRLTPDQADRYFAEFSTIGSALGAAPLPQDRAGTERAIHAMRTELRCDGRTREVARLLIGQTPSSPLAIPLQRFAVQAAVDLLPDWARRLHGLPASPLLLRPAIGSGTLQLAKTVRWAFAG